MNKGRWILLAILLLISDTFVLISCKMRHPLFSEDYHSIELVPVLKLQHDTTWIDLSYFLHQTAFRDIDSVITHRALRPVLLNNKHTLRLTPRSFSLPPLSTITFWIDGIAYSWLVRESNKSQYVFSYDQQDKRHRNVMVAGDITQWEPVPMLLQDGKWVQYFYLEPGEYAYRFIIGNRQISDPDNPLTINDPEKGELSLIKIRNSNVESLPQLEYLNFNKGRVTLKTTNSLEEVFVQWQNFLLPKEQITFSNDLLHIRIPYDADALDRSYLRIIGYNNHGISNQITIELKGGTPQNK